LDKNNPQSHDESFAPPFDEFWSRIRCIVHQTCVALVGPEDADDVCQYVAMRTFQRKVPFRDASHGQAWALTVATNLCRDIFRRKKRAREMSLDEDGWSDSATGRLALIDPHQLDPETVLLAREEDRLLRRNIDLLPPRLRIVATLHFLQEMPQGTVAATLQITPANARKRIQNARTLLRRARQNGFRDSQRNGSRRVADDTRTDRGRSLSNGPEKRRK
jgi:RNA polymerase sigma-70 factor (ECF subfamily)